MRSEDQGENDDSKPSPIVPDWPGARDSEAWNETIARLAAMDGAIDGSKEWPGSLWDVLVEGRATRLAFPGDWGGFGDDRSETLRRYGRLAEGSLTAAFILTQHDAAVRRLWAARERGRALEWLEKIRDGKAFGTVGISQLTTSRRHGPRALAATEIGEGTYRLDGRMPWVTAAQRADVIVTGAVLEDGRQLLVALPADRSGLSIQPPLELAALQASCTAEIVCEAVEAWETDILAGPALDVMATPGLTGTGGLETSALALGQSRAALVALAKLAPARDDLLESIEALNDAWRNLADDLLAAAIGANDAPPPGKLRAQANAFVLRATQAYLTARKGTGWLRSEPAQRWARQALFFLVWSCPTPVAQAALRDFAGLCDAP